MLELKQTKLINQVAKKAMSAGQKALIDNTDRLANRAVNKIIDKIAPSKDVLAKQQASALDQQSSISSKTKFNGSPKI